MSRERIAAAVLLFQGTGPDTRVYLVERARELRFFGGYHALPGGVAGSIDGDLGTDEDSVLRWCCLRELFEETGVLLDRGMAEMPEVERADLRRGLLAAEKQADHEALQLWQKLRGHANGTDGLVELCRVKTPPFAPVRYDTMFYTAHLPEGETPEIWPGELTEGAFYKPGEVLEAWERGEVLIVPPVILLLQALAQDPGNLERFVSLAQETAAGYRQGKLHRVQFTPGVILASIRTPTLPPATTTNCYIVGHDRVQIIDPGSPWEDEQARLNELLDELVAEGYQLDNIVLTHHHPDHVGGVHALSRKYRLPVRGHPLTLDRLAELDPEFIRGNAIEDGDRIELGTAPDGSDGWYLEAIFTPGHDQGHHCYRENRYDAVIVGDMISTISTIVIDPPEGHLQTYMESLTRLGEGPMNTLYPAHGPAVPDGHKLVRKYVRHRKQRQTALATALAKGPATIQELLPKVYWEVDAKMYPIAERSLLAGLQKLEEDGEAVCRDGVWQRT